MRVHIAKKLLLAAGVIFTVIGAIGIFLPVLPTTPFLLLAAWCFFRSSQRAYEWLLRNKIFGTYLKNYFEGRGMTLKTKVSTIALMWLALIAAIIIVVDSAVMSIIFIALALGVTAHLVTLRTIKE